MTTAKGKRKGTNARKGKLFVKYGWGIPESGPATCARCGLPFGRVSVWRLLSVPALGWEWRDHASACQTESSMGAALAQANGGSV